MGKVVEIMARDAAVRHYADRFGKPVSDPHVLMNAEGNWRVLYATEFEYAVAALEARGFVVVERAALIQPLREWVRKRFGPWITWRTAQAAVTTILAKEPTP